MTDRAEPHLTMARPEPRTRAVALLLHGGAELGTEPVSRWAAPPLRMIPFGRAIRRRDRSVTVARLRYRRRGWNDPADDPVADVEHALARIGAALPDVPVVLVGHSMGGRAAVRAAGHPHVVGVVALAPWLPPGDPVDPVAGKRLVIVHGTDDRRTSPSSSERFARDALGTASAVQYVPIPGGDHAMLRHAPTWHRLTADAVSEIAATI